jgi:hypothetical protein
MIQSWRRQVTTPKHCVSYFIFIFSKDRLIGQTMLSFVIVHVFGLGGTIKAGVTCDVRPG